MRTKWAQWAARLVRQPTAPLRIRSGLVRGRVAADGSHAYVGIPYASVPTGNRFQAPEPEPIWEGVFDAVNGKTICPQCPVLPMKDLPGRPVGQEDCLKLNVFTPTSPETSNAQLPVMVFIHGGGFIEGAGIPDIYGPKYLVSKGVILVTINYRLNIPGFLNLGIKEVPGNAGMKDHVAALKWVQNNIGVFGGDPGNVTIFGESAGGASVSYHLLSPMSKGLFHRAITQSGSSLCPWAIQTDPENNARLTATFLGHNINDPNELFHIFNTKPIFDLIKVQIPRNEEALLFNTLTSAPSIEKEFEGVEPFLTEEPFKLLAKGEFTKVPTIIGTSDEEGYFFVGAEKFFAPKITGKIEHSLPHNLEFSSESEKKKIADEIREMYMGDEALSESASAKLKLSTFLGDPFMTYPSLAETELLLKSTDKPVYNYCFKYSGWRNFGKVWASYYGGMNFVSKPGATHADELFYMFHQPMLSWLARFDKKMIDKTTTLWTNFAKYGDPTPETSDLLPQRWLPTNLQDPKSFVLDRQHSTVPLWFKDSLKYWRDLYKHKRKGL